MQNWLRNSLGERYRRIRICLTREVETLSSLIRRQNSGCKTFGWNVAAAGWNVAVAGWNVAAAGWNVAAAGWNVAAAGWNVAAARCNVAAAGCNVVAAGWNVVAAGWDVQDPILLVFWICLWIPKNSPQSRIVLVMKKLSKHQNLTQFD